MKKKIFGVLALLFCFVMMFAACNKAAGQLGGQDSSQVGSQGDDQDSDKGSNDGDETDKGGNNDDETGKGGTDGGIFPIQSGEVVNSRYSAVKYSSSTKTDFIDSYYDDNFYYYYFYLGEVNDVPLQSTTEVPYYHYTGNSFTKGFKKTKTTSETVEDSCTTAVSNTTTFSSTKSIDTGIDIKTTTEAESKLSGGVLSASVKEKFEFEFNLEVGYSRTKGKTDATTRTNSYKQVASNSETTEETTGFGFTQESKIGYYRYIMTGSVDVYTVVIYSKAENIYYLKTLTQVMSFGYSFDYSVSSRFNDNQCGSLEFDYSIINDLKSQIPTKPLVTAPDEVPSEGIEGSIVEKKDTLYQNSNTILIHDTGYYGLADRGHETIELADYKKYFKGNYLFCFKITLNVSKKNSGYQEIYLYDAYKTTTKEVEISSAILSYGLIRGSIMTHDSGAYDHYIYWNVRGDEIKDTMYIRYDAQGKNEDDWYKNSILVGLTIISESKELPSEQTVLNNSTTITVTDSGVYGLAARSHEQILLSSYSEYMTKDYIFVFDVTINISEKNDGYQEVYLYNKYDVTTSSDKDISYAREHGLIFGRLLEHGPGQLKTTPEDHNFNWVITGNNVKEKMYIRYDAYGTKDDTWFKNSIKVTLKVFHAPSFDNDSNASDVFT